MPKRIISTADATAKLLARNTKPETKKPAAKRASKRVITKRGNTVTVAQLTAPGVNSVQLGLQIATAENEKRDNHGAQNIGLPPELQNVPLVETNPPPVFAPAGTPNVSDPAPTDTSDSRSQRELARAAARAACEAFYTGKSVPFKFRGDIKRLSRLTGDATGPEVTHRTAAAIALLLTYCDIQPDYSFVRGSGKMPGTLLGKTGAAGREIYNTGIESGALSQLLGAGSVTYVSGEQHGAGAENAVFRIVSHKCRSNMLAFNNKRADGSGNLFTSGLRLLSAIDNAHAAAKAAKAE